MERFKKAEDIFELYFGKHWPASPTVRGDREIFQNLANAMRFVLAFYEPRHFLDTKAWENAEAGARHALKEADAILSVPVQSIDRDKLYAVLTKYLPKDATLDALWQDVEEVAWSVQPGTGVRETFYTILKKYIPQGPIDQAWQELKEAGLVQ